ncbi:unnamed protein product [Chrysoparadoxa australica]
MLLHRAFLGCLIGLASCVLAQLVDIESTWLTERAFGGDFMAGRPVQVKFSPCSAHTFLVGKDGGVVYFEGLGDELLENDGNQQDLFRINDDVQSFWDHGLFAMEFHPDFPAQPYLYIWFSGEYNMYWDRVGIPPGFNDQGQEALPWNDQCPATNIFDGSEFCTTRARLERLTLDVAVAGDGTCESFAYNQADPANRVLLMEDWCMGGITHHNGDIRFYDDGRLLLTAGDGGQYAATDYGLPGQDECFDASGEKQPIWPQGKFRSLRDDFVHGKLLAIHPEAVLKDELLGPGDYDVLAKGLRNPYRLTVDERTGDIYIGDVGSVIKEEINRVHITDLEAGNIVNFGWPCIEGINGEPNDGDRQWIDDICDPDTMLCDLCEAIYPCAFNQPGVGGCDPLYRPPVFSYRGDPIDNAYPNICDSSSVATTGLTFFEGGAFGDEGEALLPYNLIAADIGHACMWYFENLPDGRPNFQAPHLLTWNHAPSSLIQGPDGYLYSTEINAVFRSSVVSKAPPRVEWAMLVDGVMECMEPCMVADAPAAVTFDASASAPGQGSGTDIIQYQWDYGDGVQENTDGPVTAHEYADVGVYSITLTVVDNNEKATTDAKVLLIGASLDVAFTPGSGAWSVSDEIAFALTATGFGDTLDVQGWTLAIAHCVYNECSDQDDCHLHTGTLSSAGPDGGSFTAVSHELPSFMELTGSFLVNGVAFQQKWATASLTVEVTQLSMPASSFLLTSGQGEECVTPCDLEVMSGRTMDFVAPTYQAAVGTMYKFQGWEVTIGGGGEMAVSEKNLIAVTLGADTSLTAVYEPSAPTENDVDPPLLLGASGFHKHLELHWQISPATRQQCDEVVAFITPEVAGEGLVQTGAVTSATNNRITILVPPEEAEYMVQVACLSTELDEITALSPPLQVTSSADPALECYDEPGAYMGSPWLIPQSGAIDFEFYDKGGEGLSYHDSFPVNQAGAQIRGETGVDIAPCIECSGGHSVEWALAGEWLEFTVQIAYPGLYTFTVDCAAPGGDDKQKGVYFMLDQPCDEDEAIAVVEEEGGTGGWGVYATMGLMGVPLPAGQHALRACIMYDDVNFDSFMITAETPAPPTAAPTPAPTPAPRRPRDPAPDIVVPPPDSEAIIGGDGSVSIDGDSSSDGSTGRGIGRGGGTRIGRRNSKRKADRIIGGVLSAVAAALFLLALLLCLSKKRKREALVKRRARHDPTAAAAARNIREAAGPPQEPAWARVKSKTAAVGAWAAAGAVAAGSSARAGAAAVGSTVADRVKSNRRSWPVVETPPSLQGRSSPQPALPLQATDAPPPLPPRPATAPAPLPPVLDPDMPPAPSLTLRK